MGCLWPVSPIVQCISPPPPIKCNHAITDQVKQQNGTDNAIRNMT